MVTVVAIARENAAATQDAAAFADTVTNKVSQVMEIVTEVKNVANKLEKQMDVFKIQ